MMICLHFFWYFKLLSCFLWVTRYAVSSSQRSTLLRCLVLLFVRLSWRTTTASILCWLSCWNILFHGSTRYRKMLPVRCFTRRCARRARLNCAFLDVFLASCTMIFIVKFLNFLWAISYLLFLSDTRTTLWVLGESSDLYFNKSFLASLARLTRAAIPILPSCFLTNLREILPHLHTISKLGLLPALRSRLS